MVNHMRHTRAHTANRRSHHALKSPSVTLCKDCGMPKAKHIMCANCGRYKGKVIVDITKKIDKKHAKKEDKKKGKK